MAGKGGGGSWKVAYADFVTAMMAFFMVMWIGSQDEKIKQSVANYFVDPSGSSRKPVDPGSVMKGRVTGSVPQAESEKMGPGRHQSTEPGQRSPETVLVKTWINQDPKRKQQWSSLAQKAKDEAELMRDVQEGKTDRKKAAEAILANKLKLELTRNKPSSGNEVHKQLLEHSMNGVNYTQLAEDIIDQ